MTMPPRNGRGSTPGRGKKKKKAKKSLAKKADKYKLYLESVQAPDVDVIFFQRVYRTNFGKPARILREDFCGTFKVCCEWAKAEKKGQAYAIDLDPEPLAWGKKHNLSVLKAKQQERVHVIEGDVRTAKTPPADVIAAQNFSYFLFKTRDALRAYFEAAHKHLANKGVLVLDLFGGYESYEDNEEEVTEQDGFDYVWEQKKFDPISHDALFHIHFRFKDGSEIKKAFTYDWRMWSIPEIRELVFEAGFKAADVYWEDSDSETGEGNGVFRRRTRGEADPAWNAYIVAVKK